MFKIDPYLAYAKVTEVGSIDFSLGSPKDLLNNFKEYPEDAPVLPQKPQIGYFGGEYFIHAVGVKEYIAHCIYLQSAPPSEKFELLTYESREAAANRMQAIYGESRILAVEEPPIPDMEEDFALTESEDLVEAKSEIQLLLANFIKSYGEQQPRKAYGLYGHSGVSKSALVRSVVLEVDKEATASGEWGFRVASLKIGFLDKNDTQGFAIPSQLGGVNVWSDSPAMQLIVNSDDFVKSCREFLEQNPNLETENPEEYAKFKYYAKTPVIFLDELNRADKSILNAMLGFINSGKLGNRMYSLAVKIVAINDNSESLEGIQYLVTEMDDIASSARMKWLPVSGDDTAVVRNAYEFLKSTATNDLANEALDMAFQFKTPSGKRLLYDPELVDDKGKFPTFRGWEDTVKYLNKIEIVISKYGNLQKQLFVGTLGGNAADILVDWLQEIKNIEVETQPSGNELETQLTHGMEAGIPVGLFGKSGVAKSATISQVTESRDTIPYEITLSTEEKTSIGGYPRPDNFINRTFEGADSSILERYKEVARKNNVSEYATYFDPHIEVLKLVEKAKKKGKPITLIFDEVNRCSPIVQSAVFEAISEKRFKGVDLTGIDVNIVIAGNWSEMGEFSGAKDIDTATLHRTASLFIDEVTDPMIASFLQYLQRKKPIAYEVLSPVIEEDPEWFKNMLNTEASNMGTMVETKLFTMREIDMIEEEIINAGKPVFAYLDPTRKHTREELISILANEKYVFNKNDFYVVIPQEYESYATKLNVPLDTSTRELSQTLLQRLAEGSQDVSDIALLIAGVESNIYDKLFISIADTLSPDALERVEPAIKEYLSKYSYAQLHIDAAENDIFSEDVEEQARAIQYFFEKKRTREDRDFKDLFYTLVTTALEEREELVPTSRLTSAVSIYNDSQLGVNNPASGLFIHNILVNYRDKLKNEILYPLSVTYDASNLSGGLIEASVMSAINSVDDSIARDLLFSGFFGNTETAVSAIEEDIAGLVILDPMTLDGRRDFMQKVQKVGESVEHIEKVSVGVSTAGLRRFVNYRNIQVYVAGDLDSSLADAEYASFFDELQSGTDDWEHTSDRDVSDEETPLSIKSYLFKDAWQLKEASAEDNLCNLLFYLETPLGSLTINIQNVSLLSENKKPLISETDQLALSASKIPAKDRSMLSGYNLMTHITQGDINSDIDSEEIAKLKNITASDDTALVDMQAVYSQVFRRYFINGVNKIFRS